MKQFAGSDSRIQKLGLQIRRFAFVILVALSFGMMLLGKTDIIIVEKAQIAVNEAIVPIMRVLSKPASKIASFVDNIRELASLRKENARLKVENKNLLKWQQLANYLENENKKLSSLLNYTPPPKANHYAARVIAEKGGPFSKAMLAYMKNTDNVKKGQAVITGEGMVGRVDLKSKNMARILLLTDIDSRIPVITSKSRIKAILAGDNTERPFLTSIIENETIEAGEIIVTSDVAGAFPSDIPVGIVTSSKDGILRVQTFVNFSRLEYIRIVDFNLDGILPEEIVCPETMGAKE